MVRVAAVQAAPVFLDRDATVEKAIRLIAEAAAGGAQLVAFPETWIPGYPAWIFGAAGWDDAAQKRVFGRLNANAVEVPSPAVDDLCRAAKEAGVVVAMGMTERDARSSRGSLYNSILYVSDEGEVLGVHRKLMPTHAERIVWGQGDGSTLHVFETPAGRVGGLACWEHWMPLTRFAMHAKGEQIHVAAWPEVGDPELHRFATRHYAFEGRCFALCVMGARLRPDDLPEDFELREAMGATDDFVAVPGRRHVHLRARRDDRGRLGRGRGDDRLRRSRPGPDPGGAGGARRRRPLQPPRRVQLRGRRAAARAG